MWIGETVLYTEVGCFRRLFLVVSDLWFLFLVGFICDPAMNCAIPELVPDPSESCDMSAIASGLVCLLL